MPPVQLSSLQLLERPSCRLLAIAVGHALWIESTVSNGPPVPLPVWVTVLQVVIV